MQVTILEFFKDWFLPIVGTVLAVVSLGLSIWFASSAKIDSYKAQAALDEVNRAIGGWQRQIIGSTAGILDSLPQVVEGKASLARVEAAKTLTDGIQQAIQEVARNPQPGAVGATQVENVKILTEQLSKLLDGMVIQKST
jgi:hypothetical protein